MSELNAINPIDPRTLGAMSAPRQARGLAALDMGLGEAGRRDVQEVATAFQNVFLGEMVKAMRAAVPEGGLTGSSHGEAMFRSMLDQEYVRALGEQWGERGIARAVRERLEAQRSPGNEKPQDLKDQTDAVSGGPKLEDHHVSQ